MLGVGPRTPEPVVELATFSIQTGGAVGTALATVAAFGGRARYFGRLSDDEFGSIILRGLNEFGVDVSQVLIEPGKVSPGSFILVDERTGRRLTRFTRGSTTPLDPGELPRSLFDDARILLVDGPHAQYRRRRRREGQGARHHRAARRPPARRGDGRAARSVGHRDRQRAVRRRVLALLRHEAQPARADADGPEDRRHHAGRGGGRSASKARPSCASPRSPSRSTTPPGPARFFAAPSSTGRCRAGRSTACLPFANAAAALNCRHLGGTGGIPTLSEVVRAAGLSA